MKTNQSTSSNLAAPRIRCLGLMMVLLAALTPLRSTHAILGETEAQYRQRYGKPTHEVLRGSKHQGYGYAHAPYGVIALFEDERSIGEMILKKNGLTAVDIASILKSNDRGLAWRKEDMKLRKGDEEKMKAQGVLEAQVWSRSDGRAFATFIRGYDMTSKEKVLLEVLLIGSKAGVKMLTDMTSNKQAFAAKPIP